MGDVNPTEHIRNVNLQQILQQLQNKCSTTQLSGNCSQMINCEDIKLLLDYSTHFSHYSHYQANSIK